MNVWRWWKKNCKTFPHISDEPSKSPNFSPSKLCHLWYCKKKGLAISKNELAIIILLLLCLKILGLFPLTEVHQGKPEQNAICGNAHGLYSSCMYKVLNVMLCPANRLVCVQINSYVVLVKTSACYVFVTLIFSQLLSILSPSQPFCSINTHHFQPTVLLSFSY